MLQEKVPDLGRLERYLGKEQVHQQWDVQRHWNRKKRQINV